MRIQGEHKELSYRMDKWLRAAVQTAIKNLKTTQVTQLKQHAWLLTQRQARKNCRDERNSYISKGIEFYQAATAEKIIKGVHSCN